MISPNLTQPDLWILLERWQSSLLPDEEIDALQDLLIKQPDLRVQAKQFFELDADLKSLLSKNLTSTNLVPALPSISVKPPAQAQLNNSIPKHTTHPVRLPETKHGRRPIFWLGSTATFLTILTLCFYFQLIGFTNTNQQVEDWTTSNIIISEIDETLAQNATLVAGHGLNPGSYSIPSGVLKLSYTNGTFLHFKGPAEFQIVDQSKLKLEQGILGAYIPETAIGFTVITPQGQIIDRGTEFWVNQTTAGTEFFVPKGKIDVVGKGTLNQTVRIYASLKDAFLLTNKLLKEKIPVNPEFEHRLSPGLTPITLGKVAYFEHQKHNLEPNMTEDDQFIHIYKEGGIRRLQYQLPVDIIEPGHYASVEAWKNLLSAGNKLDKGISLQSYFVHYDPVGRNQKLHTQGSITFPNKIIAIISMRSTLQKTHPILGTLALHPVGVASAKSLHGVDPSPLDLDKLILSKDRRTVTLQLHAGDYHDQLRILVEEPQG